MKKTILNLYVLVMAALFATAACGQQSSAPGPSSDKNKNNAETQKLRILVVGGHPADVFDHCGGTMLRHVRAGDSVTCLALTQGLRIHDKVVSDMFRFGTEGRTKEEIARILAEREKIKYGEVKAACALFGVTDVRFLSYDDKMLLVTPELIDATAKIIRDVRPHLIITHWPKSTGNTIDHHGNAAKITLAAASLAGTVDFEDTNPAWRITDFAFMLCPADVMSFQALDGGSSAVPNYFVDVTEFVDLKVKAFDMLRSQQYEGEYARKTVTVWNGFFGYLNRIPYAEAFVLNKPVVSDRIHLSEHWLKRTNEPEKKMFERDFKIIAPFVPFPADK